MSAYLLDVSIVLAALVLIGLYAWVDYRRHIGPVRRDPVIRDLRSRVSKQGHHREGAA